PSRPRPARQPSPRTRRPRSRWSREPWRASRGSRSRAGTGRLSCTHPPRRATCPSRSRQEPPRPPQRGSSTRSFLLQGRDALVQRSDQRLDLVERVAGVRDPRVAALHRPVRGAVHEPLHQAGPVDNRFRAGVVAVSTTATSTTPSTGAGDVLDVATAPRPTRDADGCPAAPTAAPPGTASTGVGDVLDVATALRPKRDAEVCLAATTAAAAGTVTTTGALDRLSGTHGPLRRERLARPGRAQHPIPRLRHARSRGRNLCRL